jgi:hypothetical protein
MILSLWKKRLISELPAGQPVAMKANLHHSTAISVRFQFDLAEALGGGEYLLAV